MAGFRKKNVFERQEECIRACLRRHIFRRQVGGKWGR
jgi:hypothetical protein